MLLTQRYGVTLVDGSTRVNIDWLSDIAVKVFAGASTILLGVAVSSLQSMNAEIKELSHNVFDLSSHTKVMNVSIETLKERIERMEADIERLQELKADKPR